MTFRLLFDECLSPELVEMAVAAGFEATCSRDRGLLGLKDWSLVTYVVDHDMTLVTNNSRDFRGDGGATIVPLCFVRALLYKDLVNQALELIEDEDGAVVIVHYEIPAR